MKTFLCGTLTLALTTGWMCCALGAWRQNLAFKVSPAFSAGTLPTSVAAGDFNGDGWTDVAVTNQNSVSVLTNSALINTGSAGFQPRVNHTVGTNPQSGAASDLNGDGKVDLAVVNQGSANNELDMIT
jgi:hypothetical protein